MNPLALFGPMNTLFKHFTIPDKQPIDINDIHSYISNDKYPKELYEFAFSYPYKVPLLRKDGWKLVVGRNGLLRPIHYYDQKLELILLCKKTDFIK